MFGELNAAQMPSAVEALLFVSDEPVSTITLADMLKADPAEVEAALVRLRSDLAGRESGIQLVSVAGGWRLVTHPVFHDLLEKYVLSWDTRRLTQAALETLAIIAYLQPVTRAGVASVRGVNSDSSINSLVDKGLVREAGQSDAPGNPILYATTRTFLERFGLNSVKDLPSLEEYAPDQETVDLLKQGLSARTPYEQSQFEAGVEMSSADAADSLEGLSQVVDNAENIDEAVKGAMRSMFGEAIAQSAGAVEKIDFEDLEFEE